MKSKRTQSMIRNRNDLSSFAQPYTPFFSLLIQATSLLFASSKYSLNTLGTVYWLYPYPSNLMAPLSHSIRPFLSFFLAHSFVHCLLPSRSPSLFTAHYIPIYRDSPAITRFLLLLCSVRRPVGVADTSKARGGSVDWCRYDEATEQSKKETERVTGSDIPHWSKVSRGAGAPKLLGARSSFARLSEPNTH